MKTFRFFSLITLGIGLLISGRAYGQSILIDEGNFVNTNSVLLEEPPQPIAARASGFDLAYQTINIIQETSATNGFGMVDIHAEWIAGNPFSAGVSQTFNFNIFDPAYEGGLLSDTLNIVLTGQTPFGGNPNNMSMDLHFFSNSLSGLNLLPLLSGAVNITETGFFQSVNSFLPGQLAPPLSISFRSDVTPIPEPGTATLALLGAGAALLWRRRNQD